MPDDFKQASDAVIAVLGRKRRRGAEMPCLSRFLSSNEGGIWTLRDIQSRPIALVNSERKVSIINGLEAGRWL